MDGAHDSIFGCGMRTGKAQLPSVHTPMIGMRAYRHMSDVPYMVMPTCSRGHLDSMSDGLDSVGGQARRCAPASVRVPLPGTGMACRGFQGPAAGMTRGRAGHAAHAVRMLCGGAFKVTGT